MFTTGCNALVVDSNPELAKLEADIMDEANRLGVGAMGFGGRASLIGCKITAATGAASFFVSVAYDCWAFRRLGVRLDAAGGAITSWLYRDPERPAQKMAASAGFPLTGREMALRAPLSEGQVRALKVGDVVLISGECFTGRDAVHHHLMKHDPPVDLHGPALVAAELAGHLVQVVEFLLHQIGSTRCLNFVSCNEFSSSSDTTVPGLAGAVRLHGRKEERMTVRGQIERRTWKCAWKGLLICIDVNRLRIADRKATRIAETLCAFWFAALRTWGSYSAQVCLRRDTIYLACRGRPALWPPRERFKDLVRSKEADCRSLADCGAFSTSSINFIRSSWVANRQAPDSKVPRLMGPKLVRLSFLTG